jgi:hypothetical protein
MRVGKEYGLVVKRTNRLSKDGIATYRVWKAYNPIEVLDIAVAVSAYRSEYAVPLISGLANSLRNEPRT